MIYVNGDSHTAGADIIPGICFAQDDPRYLAYGRRPHPEAVVETWGYKVAQIFNQGFFCDAESGSSNQRILRTTRNFLDSTKDKTSACVIIGWTTWEREEWQDGEDYVQVTASGTDSVPEHMAEEYKQWVSAQTPSELERKRTQQYKEILELHHQMRELDVKHLFFHVNESVQTQDFGLNWHPIVYTKWLLEQGHQTSTGHFDSKAHTAWANFIQPTMMQLWNVKGQFGNQLTVQQKRRTIEKIKRSFTGFQQ